VEKRQEEAFKTALASDSDVALADRIAGINLNGGRNLDLGVYARKGRLR
jgi:hypothetical protein